MLEIIRGSVRPVISVIFASVIAQVVVEQIPVPGVIWALLSGVILWWFGTRTYERTKQ